MPWRNLSKYLNRFKVIKPPKEFVQGTALEVINKITGLYLKKENIECRGGIVYLKANNPMIKNQIFLYKTKILEEFVLEMGNRAPREIRF